MRVGRAPATVPAGAGRDGGREGLPTGEAARKAVHAGMAVFALALGWLSWPAAAACAAAAFGFNWLVLPRLVGHRLASARPGASDRGVLLYPAVVLTLILAFRERLEVVAFGWGVLAFGDAAAGVVGQRWGKRPLPWNPRKTWEGLVAGAMAGLLGGGALWWFVATRRGENVPLPSLQGEGGMVLAFFAGAALLAALVESAPLAVDDNLLAPWVGAVALAALLAGWQRGAEGTPWPCWVTGGEGWLVALAVNGACALAAAATRVLTPAGIGGALVLGLGSWGLGGVRLWVVLLVFLLLGTAVTWLGWRRKLALGIAEGDAGRRGLGNVAAKGVVVLVAAVLNPFAEPTWCALAAVAALAAALADTAGSEVGKAFAGRAYALPCWRPVPPGTAGAVSLLGLLASLAGGAVVGMVALWLGLLNGGLALLSAAVGVGAALVESGFDRRVGHDAVNFTLTVTAAVAALGGAVAARWLP